MTGMITIGILLAWIKVFYYCLPFWNIGSFIRVIIEIFSDIRYFLIVVLICLLGFGTAFFVLYKQDWEVAANGDSVLPFSSERRRDFFERNELDGIGKVWEESTNFTVESNPRFLPPYANLQETFIGVWVLMLGDWNVNQFVHSSNPMMAMSLFLLFTFCMMVVLFNLLIAIMADTYERVLSMKNSR